MKAWVGRTMLLAAATAGAAALWGGTASAQPKIVEPQKKRPQQQCADYPVELVGSFRQTLVFEKGDHVQTHVTNGTVTWKRNSVGNRNLLPTEAALQRFYAKSRCPVHIYMVAAGELRVDTEVSYERPMSCHGRGNARYDARRVLFDRSLLFLSDNGYLIGIGASDADMGDNNVTLECKDRAGRKSQHPPIEAQMDPNFIQIQDRAGSFVYGVHGEINPAITVSANHRISARWDFAAPGPAP